MLSRFCVVGFLIASIGLVAWPDQALARSGSGGSGNNGIWGSVECDQSPSPGCELVAGSTDRHSTAPTRGGSGKSGGAPTIIRCAYKLTPYVPPTGAMPPPEGSSTSEGAWYVSSCSGYHFGMAGGGIFYPPVWIANAKAKPLSPAQLATEADRQLRLPSVSIELSPNGEQLVNLPTWLALGSGSWGTQSATASVPGVSVTATATPTFASWSLGDGHTVTCDGPGTAYTPGANPDISSPTCGFTYRTSSARQPNRTFTVTATVHWSVTWAGAGQRGVLAGLTTTATLPVAVAESESLNTN